MAHVIRVLVPIMVALLSLTQHGCKKSADEKKLENIKERLVNPNIIRDTKTHICMNELPGYNFKSGAFRNGKEATLFLEILALCEEYGVGEDEKKLENIKERLENPNITRDKKHYICENEVANKVFKASGLRKEKLENLFKEIVALCEKYGVDIAWNPGHFHEGEQEAAVQAKPYAQEDDVEKRGPAKFNALSRAQNKEENSPAKLINHFPEQDDKKRHMPSQLVLDRDT